jgi:hypothetical protein
MMPRDFWPEMARRLLGGALVGNAGCHVLEMVTVTIFLTKR